MYLYRYDDFKNCMHLLEKYSPIMLWPLEDNEFLTQMAKSKESFILLIALSNETSTLCKRFMITTNHVLQVIDILHPPKGEPKGRKKKT